MLVCKLVRPSDPTVPLPRVVVPSLKVTVPVGLTIPDATVTVANNVTNWPLDGLVGETVSAVVVPTRLAVPLTVTVKLVAVLNVPSFTVTVIVVTPVCPLAGMIVTVRALPEPPKLIPAVLLGTSVGLDELPVTVKLTAAVSASPTVKLNGPTDTPVVVV